MLVKSSCFEPHPTPPQPKIYVFSMHVVLQSHSIVFKRESQTKREEANFFYNTNVRKWYNGPGTLPLIHLLAVLFALKLVQ